MAATPPFRTDKVKKLALPPGPRSLFPLRQIRILRRDVIGFLNYMAANYGDISCFRLGPQLIYLVSSPDLIQETLMTQHASLHKTWIIPNVEDGLGQGMLTSKGEFHWRQRKLIQPALHKQRVRGYANTMIQIADRTARSLREGSTVNMAEEMRRLTLSVVAQTLFGSDIADEADEIGRAITQLSEIYIRVKSPIGQALHCLPFLPVNRRFEQAKRRLDETIYRIIRDRRKSGDARDDLLAMLLASRYEDGTAMPDSLVRDETVSLFLAGHETTGITLTWIWYVLSQHPEVEEEFHRELDEVLSGRLPEPDDLEHLSFTRKIIAEAIRLYPAIYLIPRRAVERCTLGGFAVRPGALVFVNIYSLHHDARFFLDPERFDPFRWTPEMKDSLPRYAYCAFGAGPHACMGEIFAWTEAMLVMAVMGQRWKARVASGHTVDLNPLVNLRPRHGMPMTLIRRRLVTSD
jgi:cytochrome P450